MKDKISQGKIRIAFISYLDEHDDVWEGMGEIISFDQFLIRFKISNSGNVITLPVSRLLKVKEKGVKE